MEPAQPNFNRYEDPFHNDLAAEVRRLEQSAAEESNSEKRQEIQDEADKLSRELVRYLNVSTKGEFRHHSVPLSERDFAPFSANLSWTSNSFGRQPMRKTIAERIIRDHHGKTNDLFLLEEISLVTNRPTGNKAVLFLDASGISGGPSGYLFVTPRKALEFIKSMGLTKKAAQQLYFDHGGPSVFTTERAKNSGERKL